MDDHLFLFVYANIYEDIKSVSEISIKEKKNPYSTAALAACVCLCVRVCEGVCV